MSASDIACRRPGLQIGRHHFALFRSALDGLSLDVLGDRYLETGSDGRQGRKTLDWVCRETTHDRHMQTTRLHCQLAY